MKLIRWLLIFAFASPLMAQNTRWDLPIYTTQAQGGNLLPVYAIPGALISFYSCSAPNVCSALANTYNSSSSTTACPTYAQVVLNGSATCVSNADPYGNMGAWFLPGQYMATILAQGRTYNYYFTVGGGGGGGSGCITSGAAGTFNVSNGSGGCETAPATYGVTPNSFVFQQPNDFDVLPTAGGNTNFLSFGTGSNDQSDFTVTLNQPSGSGTATGSGVITLETSDAGGNSASADINLLATGDAGTSGNISLLASSSTGSSSGNISIEASNSGSPSDGNVVITSSGSTDVLAATALNLLAGTTLALGSDTPADATLNSSEICTMATGCGGGGSGVTLQTNSVNNGLQTILNFQTSNTNSVGLTITPFNPSGGLEKFEITGGSYTGTAAGLAGGALGSAPYQSAANATSFIASPTTSGHAFVYAWQPIGSAIAPTAVDLGTYLGTNITASSPIVATPSTLGTAISCPTCGTTGGGTSVSVNGGSSLGSLNINATAPVADASNLALTPKISGANMITEAPYATTSTFGVVEPDNSTIGITAGVIRVLSSGTVTSVAQTVPNGFSIAGSPITSTGTLAITTTGLTSNTVLKAISGGIGNSQMTDDGTNPVKSPNGFDVVTTGGYDAEFPNNVSIGTTLQTLTCDDGGGHAVICPHTTSTTNQPVGFTVSGAGTTGNVTACNLGWCSVKFDNTSVPRDYAIESSTVDGELHDTGSTTLTSGQPNFFVWTANSGAGTAGQVRLLIADDFNASSSKGGNNPGGANTDVQYNHSGAFGGDPDFTTNGSGGVTVHTLNGFFFYPTADSSNHSANIGGALPAAQTGNANTATGVQSLTANTTGNDNTAYGFGSLNSNTIAGSNTAFGFEALTDLTGSGDNSNTAIGFEAMALYTSGGSNTAVGENALHGITSSSGSFNVALGATSLAGNQTGADNTGIGYGALNTTTVGDLTAVGFEALLADTTGTYNNAVGSSALAANTTGSDNVAIGNQAAATNTTGSDNIALGRLSDYNQNAMSQSIFIGYHTGSSTNTLTNQIDIGYDVQGTASNQTNLGNSSVTSLIIYGCPTGKSVLDDGSGTCYTPSAGGAVSSVSNSDGTLTISPTTGSVVASLNLGHSNTWTAPIAVNVSGAASQIGFTYNSTALVPGSSTTSVLGVNSSGQGMLSEAGGTAARICDATNGVCAAVSNAITSATGGSGTGTVTCLTAACTNLRGTYSVAGGTFTTGTFLTLVWPTTTTAYACTVVENGGGSSTPTFFGLGHSVATATGMTISTAVTILSTTVTLDYSCQP